MLKSTGISGAFATVEVKPYFVQQLLELGLAGRNVVAVLQEILVTILHGSSLKNSLQKRIDLATFHTGQSFLVSCVTCVVVQQGDKGLIGGTTKGLRLNAGEKRIFGVLFPKRLFALLYIYGVINERRETIHIQFPHFLDSIAQVDVKIEFAMNMILFWPEIRKVSSAIHCPLLHTT